MMGYTSSSEGFRREGKDTDNFHIHAMRAEALNGIKSEDFLRSVVAVLENNEDFNRRVRDHVEQVEERVARLEQRAQDEAVKRAWDANPLPGSKPKPHCDLCDGPEKRAVMDQIFSIGRTGSGWVANVSSPQVSGNNFRPPWSCHFFDGKWHACCKGSRVNQLIEDADPKLNAVLERARLALENA